MVNERKPNKLYKIGELIEFTGLSRQVIHNYTMLGLISESARTRSGHRLYGEDVFERLRRIQELKKSNTLLEVRRLLGEGGAVSEEKPRGEG
jgi:DNA-binding transcriptional MerR regulator